MWSIMNRRHLKIYGKTISIISPNRHQCLLSNPETSTRLTELCEIFRKEVYIANNYQCNYHYYYHF